MQYSKYFLKSLYFSSLTEEPICTENGTSFQKSYWGRGSASGIPAPFFFLKNIICKSNIWISLNIILENHYGGGGAHT